MQSGSAGDMLNLQAEHLVDHAIRICVHRQGDCMGIVSFAILSSASAPLLEGLWL